MATHPHFVVTHLEITVFLTWLFWCFLSAKEISLTIRRHKCRRGFFRFLIISQFLQTPTYLISDVM
jgi:hypothetical protein